MPPRALQRRRLILGALAAAGLLVVAFATGLLGDDGDEELTPQRWKGAGSRQKSDGLLPIAPGLLSGRPKAWFFKVRGIAAVGSE